MLEQLIAEARERARGLSGPRLSVEDRGFCQALRAHSVNGRLAVIAEVKPRSPTEYHADLTPRQAAERALEYQCLGAAAISVLTEPLHFGGSVEHLRAVRDAVEVPVLRKDFIVEEAQLDEVESDAVLLVSRTLGKRLQQMVVACLDRGVEPLVETHTTRELGAALGTAAPAVGVNNRDLTTLKVDTANALRLLPLARGSGKVLVAESGITNAAHALRAKRAGAHAVLVGNALMRDPGLLPALRGGVLDGG